MDFYTQLRKENIDTNDYHALHKRKRELISIILAYEGYKRFLMLKLPPTKEVLEKLEYCKDNNMSISDIHLYVKHITDMQKILRERSSN